MGELYCKGEMSLYHVRIDKLMKESKQVGNLYHITSLINLLSIIKTNQLRGAINGISTTRDKLGWKHIRGLGGSQCYIVLDGDKISDNYKVTPYQDLTDAYSDEQEEYIHTRLLKNVSKYIKEIVLIHPENYMLDYKETILINRLIGITNLEEREIFSLKNILEFLRSRFKVSIITTGDKFKEDFQMKDFTQHAAASDFTRDWIEVRRKIKGPGNVSAKLTSIRVNRKKDYVTFVFKSKPTYSSKETAVDPSVMVLSKTVKQYTQMIRVLDFFKWAETKPGYQKYHLTWKEVKEILEVASIQVWCNCGSFQFQGMNHSVSVNNAAIYPETRAPKRWNKYHQQDNYLCKHLSMIFNSMAFFVNPMASMVNKYLKQVNAGK